MDRMRGRLLILLTTVALVTAGQAAAQPQASRSHARLSLSQPNPLKVRGAGFHRHERVRVVARIDGAAPMTRHVKARRSGGFVVSFPAASGPCGHLRVSATGSEGSRAALSNIRVPDCIVR
jgi:hypothetical protein